jgi:hypothetical protein
MAAASGWRFFATGRGHNRRRAARRRASKCCQAIRSRRRIMNVRPSADEHADDAGCTASDFFACR